MEYHESFKSEFKVMCTIKIIESNDIQTKKIDIKI